MANDESRKTQLNRTSFLSKDNKSYKIGDRLELSVKKIVPNGLGLCFAEALTVFVPLSVKGDELLVEIRKIQGRTAFAKIVEILKPSENRITPKCQYFGICGGCNFQQMSYQTQLEAKLGILRDSLQRIGKIDYPGEIPIIPSPKEYNYRLRTQLHADTKDKTIGFFKRQSHDIIDAKSCPVLVPELEQNLNDLRENLVWEDFAEKEINIETASGQHDISVYSEELMEPTNEIFYELDGKRFFFNAQSFFQSNGFVIKDLVQTAIGDASGKTAIDLFCGVGLFSLLLAKRFERVLGCEANKRAINFANKNAEREGISNARFYAQRAKNFLLENEFEDVDFLLLDPPRSGVKRSTLEAIAKLNSPKITYVSCNPSTLSRDLQVLIGKGYQIQKITALDLFPQTHHVESVVCLTV